MTYGTFQVAPALSWPVKEPASVLDFVLVVDGSASSAERVATVTNAADICTDQIMAASLAVQPSGAGEMSASTLSVVNGAISVWMSGGVPGRQYQVAITATTATRTYQWFVGIRCDPFLATWPIATAAAPGFGVPIFWQLSDDSSFMIVGS